MTPSDHQPHSAEDPLAALRRATAGRHQRLDAGLPVSGAEPGLAGYAAHLHLLRGWLGPIEAWLAGFEDGPQAVADLAPCGRLDLIEADLREPGMGAAPPAAPAGAVWPAGASAAWRWGVCYVVEGSQLGGSVLYQRLAPALAPHPLRYLRGDAAGPGPRWRAFMLALRAQVCTPEQVAEAVDGACAAFDRILAQASLD